MSIKILSIGHSYVLSVNRKLPNEIARLTDGKWDVTTIAPSHLYCDPSIPVIGYLGRLVPEKGIRQLMQIFDRLSTPCRILFIGSGYLKSEIEDWSHQFPDRVRVVTNATHTDIPQYLNMMDILVAPSQTAPNWREQFGRMLIEAMACGVPVIGSDSGEIPYVIGRAGLVVEESNIDKWVEAIENLLDSPEKRKELALLGLERVKHYSWENIARQYINFFTEIMESKV